MKQPGVPTAVTPMTHARQSTKTTSTGPKTTTRMKMMKTSNDFPNTRAALTEYEAKAPALEKARGEAWATEQLSYPALCQIVERARSLSKMQGMTVYKVIVPYQNDMGSINPFLATSSSMESANENALWHINSMRDRDGLRRLTRLPQGTQFAPTSSGDPYGWCEERHRARAASGRERRG
jgi:hypothetical protein